jgi:Nif-specific regulatory protein
LGIAGAVIQTGQTINVEDAHQDPRFHKDIDLRSGYRTRSLLAVPLRKHEGQIIGTFEVLNKATGSFSKDDEEILKALAAQAAIAIETAQLVEEMKRHRAQLQEENSQLWKEVEGRFATQNIIGTSEKIHAVLQLIHQISNSTVNVLITGESGTGKELAAKAIHYKSQRTRKPFVALNCAALPESLVESELFGIERGVATGAAAGKIRGGGWRNIVPGRDRGLEFNRASQAFTGSSGKSHRARGREEAHSCRCENTLGHEQKSRSGN